MSEHWPETARTTNPDFDDWVAIRPDFVQDLIDVISRTVDSLDIPLDVTLEHRYTCWARDYQASAGWGATITVHDDPPRTLIIWYDELDDDVCADGDVKWLAWSWLDQPANIREKIQAKCLSDVQYLIEMFAIDIYDRDPEPLGKIFADNFRASLNRFTSRFRRGRRGSAGLNSPGSSASPPA